jgi:hypothetical protein
MLMLYLDPNPLIEELVCCVQTNLELRRICPSHIPLLFTWLKLHYVHFEAKMLGSLLHEIVSWVGASPDHNTWLGICIKGFMSGMYPLDGLEAEKESAIREFVKELDSKTRNLDAVSLGLESMEWEDWKKIDAHYNPAT